MLAGPRSVNFGLASFASASESSYFAAARSLPSWARSAGHVDRARGAQLDPHHPAGRPISNRHGRTSSANAAASGMRISAPFPSEEKGLAHHKTHKHPGQRPDACSVEVLAAYSHSAHAADLRLCHTATLPSPCPCPVTECAASGEPARPPL
jgi:hypothetical protein